MFSSGHGTAGAASVTTCNLPSEVGPCRDIQERWYFDTQMQKCLPFQYGGCEGNANNFATMDECSSSC
ncbi:hypothetical protein HELRODRAFT_68139, partial [Helobdella robusta]|uniref:BPTI/Kunitz inhibitor domain-containing protein n=1 Tax=Helobdella robusta TaxID=6412 RepID=T1FZA8_HELRO